MNYKLQLRQLFFLSGLLTLAFCDNINAQYTANPWIGASPQYQASNARLTIDNFNGNGVSGITFQNNGSFDALFGFDKAADQFEMDNDLDLDGILRIEGSQAIEKVSGTMFEFGNSGMVNYFPSRMGINAVPSATVDLIVNGGSDTRLVLQATSENKIDFDQSGTNDGYIKMIGDYMEFRNNNGDIEFTKSNLGQPHMIIKNNGFVGIGTDNPTQDLEIHAVGSTTSADIKLVSPGSQFVRFNNSTIQTGYVGVASNGSLVMQTDNPSGFLELDSETHMKFAIENASAMTIDNSRNVAIGKSLNIGSTLVPTSSQALVISDAKEIAMVGDNAYIQWFASTRTDHTGSNAGFVGVNQSGNMFIESNLSKVTLDGETGLDILGSDEYRARMNAEGQWVFGGSVIDPAFRMCVEGDVKVGGLCIQGDMKIEGEFLVLSDMRLKKNIHALDGGLKTLLSLNPVTYEFKTDEFELLGSQTDLQMGFLAQEIEALMPELVQTGALVSDKSGNSFQAKSMNYIQLIPLLTKAIQEQQDIMDGQQHTIEKSIELIHALETRISALEKLNK